MTYEVVNDIYFLHTKVYAKGDRIIDPQVQSITVLNGEEKVSPLGKATGKRYLTTEKTKTISGAGVVIDKSDLQIKKITRIEE